MESMVCGRDSTTTPYGVRTMSDIKEMTVEEMDAWASIAYATFITTGQEAEARVVERLGEYIRELGRRLEKVEL